MPRAPKKKLTAEEWRRTFSLRCRSKQGQSLSGEELKLLETAFNEDAARYRSQEADVFDATVPFGSNVRAKRTPP